MEKEITATDYQPPPLELLDEYIPESKVTMHSVLSDDAFRNSGAELPVAPGRTSRDKAVVFDLAKAPDLLIAGATKQGKTAAIHAIVASLLYSRRPSELKLVLIDPKGCEFSSYKRLSGSYIASMSGEEPVVRTAAHADKTLAALRLEMEHRYELLSGTHTRNILLDTPGAEWLAGRGDMIF